MVSIMVMSGVDDGMVLNLEADSDGQSVDGAWVLTIGRREEHDISLRGDSFISRDHAQLRLSDGQWWLFDNDSRNGSFLENGDEDHPVKGSVSVSPGQLFRIGRTWLRIQPTE